MTITIDQLKGRARITLPEFAELIGLSKSTIYRRNWQGDFIPFSRDPQTHRIWYQSSEVLKYLESIPKYSSTSAYEHDGCQRMEIARASKNGKAKTTP